MTRAPLDHIVLLAGDLAASVQWYDGFLPLFGFEKTRDHVYRHPDGWSVDLRPAGEDGAPYGRYNAGLNHIALRVADAASVLELRKAFMAKGFDAPDPQVFDNVETVVFFADPDGVRWEVGHELETP